MRLAQKFTYEEIVKAEKMANSIGRCAEQIYKIEQLHSMNDVTLNLIKTTDKVQK